MLATDVLSLLLDPALLLDEHGHVIQLNPPGAEMAAAHLGLSAQQILGQSVWDIEPELAHTALGAALARALSNGAAERVTSSHRGGARWLEAQIARAEDTILVILRDITAARRTEQQLARLEQRLAAIGQIDSVLFWAADKDGLVSEEMPGWRNFTGLAPAALMGDGWLQDVHPDDRDRVAEIWAQAVVSAAPYQAEYRLRRADGSYSFTVAHGVPVHDADGAVREWVGATAVIDTQKELDQKRHAAEREAAAQRELLDALIREAPACIAIQLGPEHVYVLQNPMAQTLVGGRDCTGLSLSEVFPDLPKETRALLDHVYRTGESFVTREFRSLLDWEGTGKPEERFFDFTYQPLRDSDGQIIGVLTFAVEVTGQVRARRRLESMFEANLIGNIFWKMDGTITRANDAFLHSIGYSREELERGSVDWRELTPPEYREADEEKLQQMREQGFHLPYEKEYIRKDGTRVPLFVATNVFPDTPFEGFSYIVDLTQVKQAEATVRDLLVREQAARAQAESASRAKDEFLAMLGHELRNPLAPISAALGLMKLNISGSWTRELEVIERQVGHMVRLVDDLLDVSRIARGKVELRHEPVVLREVVARAVEMVSPLLEERRHQLTLDIADDAVVIGDEDRLAQIVGNLLSNAAKYTDPEGAIAVCVQRQGAEVMIAVRDNGIGIAPEMLPSLFELFAQGPRSLNRGPGGLGLGLALVDNLTRRHGGRVIGHSEGPGTGSEFLVFLPAAHGPAPMAEARTRETARARTQGKAILLVDDNVDAAELMGELLGAYGYNVRLAHDGPTALKVIEQFVPEVAVLDLGLPVMDGFELAARLKERLGPGLRMIAVTGYGQISDRQRTSQAGFAQHLVKPVDTKMLLAAVEEAPKSN